MSEDNGNGKNFKEEFKLKGSELIDKIKELVHEGNIRKISIKTEDGKTLLEFPLTLGLVGAAIAPLLAAVGAVAALISKCTLVVEKEESGEENKDSEKDTEQEEK
ncbi:MAG: DUF4342 domain-containing protein [bacterium]|nr:DUF4342 domain-containing protein [bacterium]